MRRSTHISLSWWINFISVGMLLSGCQTKAPSLRMLDTRAGYSFDPGDEDEEIAIYQRAHHPRRDDKSNKDGGEQESLIRRAVPSIAKVYIYPHELPSRDYFWGGFVSLVISADRWVFENPEDGFSSDSKDENGTPLALKNVSRKSTPMKRNSSKLNKELR